MKITKTVKLEMTEKEREAVKTVFRMLYDLEWEDEKVVADELGYDDLMIPRADLTRLYELGGGREEEL